MVNMRDFIVNRREKIPRVIRKSPREKRKQTCPGLSAGGGSLTGVGGKPYRGKWVSEKRKPRDARG